MGKDPLFGKVWQKPFVDVFKKLNVHNGSHCRTSGDCVHAMDKTIGKSAFRIRGAVPASNFLSVPAQGETLGLTGKYVYIQLRVPLKKYYTLHLDLVTTQNTILRLSVSNLYKEVKASDTTIQVPGNYFKGQWTMLALDVPSLVEGYTSWAFRSVRSFQFCSTLSVANVFTSSTMFTPSTLPRDMKLPLPRGATWTEKYQWLWVYCTSEDDEKKQLDETNQQDMSSMTQSIGPADSTMIQNSSAADWMGPPASMKALAQQLEDKAAQRGRDAIDRTGRSSKLSMTGLSTRSRRSRARAGTEYMRKDPIMRLNRIIGFSSSEYHNLTWSADGESAIYSSNNTIVVHNLSTGKQRFLRGHSAPVSTLALSPQGTLLASAQVGDASVIRIWDLEEQKPSKVCLGFLMEHRKDVCSLTWSIDGVFLAGVGKDDHSRTQLVVWDMSNVRSLGSQVPIAARQLSEFSVSKLRFSPYPDKAYQLVSCGDENVRFWRLNLSTGHLPAMSVTLNEHSRVKFHDVAFETASNTEDDVVKRVYVAADSGCLYQISFDDRQLEVLYRLHSNAITSVIINEGFCVTGSRDGFLRVWPMDFVDFYLQAQHGDGIELESLAVSRDGLKVLAGCSTGAIGLMDLASTQYTSLLRSHGDIITDLAIDPHPGRLEMATTSLDGTIRVWSLVSCLQIYEFKSQDPVLSVSYDSNSNHYRLVCGFKSGHVRICDIATTTITVSYRQHNSPVCQVLFDPRGSYMFSRSQRGYVCAYDVHNNYQPTCMVSPSTLMGSKPIQNAMPVSNNTYEADKYTKSGAASGTDASAQPVAVKQDIDTEWAWALSPNGALLAASAYSVAGNNKPTPTLIVVYSCPSMTKYCEFDTHSRGVTGLCFSVDNQEVLAITAEGKVQRYGLAERSLLAETSHHKQQHSSTVHCSTLARSVGGRFIALGSKESVIQVWDYSDLNVPLRTQLLSGHLPREPVRGLAFFSSAVDERGRPTLDRNAGDDEKHQEQKQRTFVVSAADSSIFLWKFRGDDSEFNPAALRPSVSSASAMQPEESGSPKVVHSPVRPASPPTPLAREDDRREEEKQRMQPYTPYLQLRQSAASRTMSDTSIKPSFITPQRVIGYNGRPVNNVAWHAESGCLAYTSGHHVIFQSLTTADQRVIAAHVNEVSALAISPNGRTLVSASSASPSLISGGAVSSSHNSDDDFVVEPSLCLWDTATGERVGSLQPPPRPDSFPSTWPHHRSGVQAVAFSPDGKYLVSIGLVTPSSEGFICLWNWASPHSKLLAYASLSHSVAAVQWMAGMGGFLTGGAELTYWHVDTEQRALTPTTLQQYEQESHINCLAVQRVPLVVPVEFALPVAESKSTWVFAGDQAGLLHVWEIGPDVQELVCSWPVSDNSLTSVAHRYPNVLVVGDANGNLTRVVHDDIAAQGSSTTLQVSSAVDLQSAPVAVCLDDKAQMGVVGTRGSTLWFVDFADEECGLVRVISSPGPVREPEASGWSMVCNPSGSLVSVVGDDGSAGVWTADTGLQIMLFRVPEQDCTCSAFHPTTNLLALGYSDGVRFIDFSTSELLGACPLPSAVSSLVYSPDGSFLLSGTESGFVFEIDADMKPVTGIRAHSSKSAVTALDIVQEDNVTHWIAVNRSGHVSAWRSTRANASGQRIHKLRQRIDVAAQIAQDPLFDARAMVESGSFALAKFVASNPDVIVCGHSKVPQLMLYSVASGQWSHKVELSSAPTSMCVVGDASLPKSPPAVAVGAADGTVAICQLEYQLGSSASMVCMRRLHSDIVRQVAFSSSSRALFSLSLTELTASTVRPL